MPYPQLLEYHYQEVQLARRQEEKNHGPYKKALDRLLGQIALYQDIQQGSNWMVFYDGERGDRKEEWFPLLALLGPPVDEIKKERPQQYLAATEKLLQQSKARYLARYGDKHLIELFYAKSSIHLIAMGMILLSIFLLVLIKNPLPGLIGAGLCVLAQLIAIILRIIISGRAPITNMYETVLFSGLAALVIALVIGHLRREKIYVISGLAYNFLCALMINFSHGMVSGDISPLVPVLRDNFWLSTHVTTVILSYAGFCPVLDTGQYRLVQK